MANRAHVYQSRSGNYYVSFHHPICREGTIGKKIHRSLKVDDAMAAAALTERLNDLLNLADTPAHLPTRADAAGRYPQVVVDAFYDCMTAEPTDYLALREAAMPMPIRIGHNGLTTPRVLFVGGTGNGKSRFIQHLLGTTAQNFPMRGAGRTTVSDIEIIAADVDYAAAITFFSRNEVAQILRENIVEACAFARHERDDAKIASKLLIDSDKRFRFNFVLGEWPTDEDEEDDTDINDLNFTIVNDRIDPASQTWPDLESCVKRVRQIANVATDRSLENQGADGANDDDNWFQFIDHEHVDELTEEIVSELGSRLSLATGAASWPAIHKIADATSRDAFFRKLEPFYQNNRKLFGRLVTPLVQGIRVCGRFFTPMTSPIPWILIDGQGIGHEQHRPTGIDRTVPPELAKKFADADVICLVDKAMPAMTGDSPILLEHLLVRGYLDRLALIFTHFEAVSAPDLNARGRRSKVLEGISNAVQSIALPKAQRVLLEQEAESRSYFFANLDQQEIRKQQTRNEIVRFCERIRHSIVPHSTIRSRPHYNRYDIANLLTSAIREYRADWSERALARPNYKILEALTNWIGHAYADGYPKRRLYPGQNLAERLVSKISIELEAPREWTPQEPDAQEQSRILNAIRNRMSDDIDSYCREALIQDPRTHHWLPAYRNISGPGTKIRRARVVARILEDRAELPDEGIGKFADDVWNILQQAIEQVCAQGVDTAA